MKLSVVIPCYNGDRWLEQTLGSVSRQTQPAHEVIVVDDGSTDGSLARLAASEVPTAVLQTPQLGPAAARNAGIEAATGDWIAFLDVDDWWHPTHLERIQALVANSQDVVYLAAAEHYSIHVERVVSMSDTGPLTQPTTGMDHERYFELYLRHGLLELSGAAVRRDRLQAIGGFDPALRGAEDFDLVLRAIHHHTWAYDPVPSSVYRCNNPESHSQRFAQSEGGLTAKFRVLLQQRSAYPVSDAMLGSLARTLMSKAVTYCDGDGRQRVRQLVNPYLSASQRRIFTLASAAPWLYRAANGARAQLRGPRYRPRQEVPAPPDPAPESGLGP